LVWLITGNLHPVQVFSCCYCYCYYYCYCYCYYYCYCSWVRVSYCNYYTVSNMVECGLELMFHWIIYVLLLFYSIGQWKVDFIWSSYLFLRRSKA